MISALIERIRQAAPDFLVLTDEEYLQLRAYLSVTTRRYVPLSQMGGTRQLEERTFRDHLRRVLAYNESRPERRKGKSRGEKKRGHPCDTNTRDDQRLDAADQGTEPAVPRSRQEPTARQPLLDVPAWSQLALGLDERGDVWAISPPPAKGEVFRKARAVRLPLKGKRWRSLLELAAGTVDGRTVSKSDVLHEFGYIGRPSRLGKDARARPGEVESAQIHEQGLTVKQSGIPKKLRLTLSDLRRRLREVVRGPDESPPSFLVSHETTIDIGFVVRALILDDSGRWKFGATGAG